MVWCKPTTDYSSILRRILPAGSLRYRSLALKGRSQFKRSSRILWRFQGVLAHRALGPPTVLRRASLREHRYPIGSSQWQRQPDLQSTKRSKANCNQIADFFDSVQVRKRVFTVPINSVTCRAALSEWTPK